MPASLTYVASGRAERIVSTSFGGARGSSIPVTRRSGTFDPASRLERGGAERSPSTERSSARSAAGARGPDRAAIARATNPFFPGPSTAKP
jgi:hypothetical protein